MIEYFEFELLFEFWFFVAPHALDPEFLSGLPCGSKPKVQDYEGTQSDYESEVKKDAEIHHFHVLLENVTLSSQK